MEYAKFPGQRASARYVTTPTFQRPDDMEPMPVYRVMNSEGAVLATDQDPQVLYSKDAVLVCTNLTPSSTAVLRCSIS